MTAVNSITGDLIKTKGQSEKYRSGWDAIDWSKKDDTPVYELQISNSPSFKGNRYKIVEEQPEHVKLECVWFCGDEDLGDQIMCTEESQTIWIAKYFSDNMERVKISN